MKFLAENSEYAKVIPDKLFKSSEMQNQLSVHCLALKVLGAKINFIAFANHDFLCLLEWLHLLKSMHRVPVSVSYQS